MTQLAHTSKETCQIGRLGIEVRGTNCSKLMESNCSYLAAILSAKELNLLNG